MQTQKRKQTLEMKINRFAPGLGLTLSVAVSLLILASLGVWQYMKVAPKTELLARIEAGLGAAPMALPLHVDAPLALDYHRVKFTGTVGAAIVPVRVFGLNLEGQPGYFLYAPVKRPHGAAVIVNFGWVPIDYAGDIALPKGKQHYQGILRQSAYPGMMTPDNDPSKGTWFTADVAALAAHFGLGSKDYYPFRVFLDGASDAQSLPQLGQVQVSIPNNHFQYALTWFGLGLALIGVYVAFGFKNGRKATP